MNSDFRPKTDKKRIPIFEWIAIAFFAYYYLLPSASLTMPFLVMIGLGLVYLAYVFFFKKPSKNAKGTIIKIAVIILLVSIYYYLFTVTNTVSAQVDNYELKRFISKFQQLFFMMLPMIFTYRIIKFGSAKQKAAMLIFCAALVVYVIIQSLQELAVNDTASRVWGEFNDMSEKNVGTYNFVYAVSVSLPAIFATLFHTKSNGSRISLTALLVIGIIFLVMSQYTISFLLTIILCFIGIFLSAKKSATKVMVFILCPIFIIFLPDLIEFFAERYTGGSMQTRLLEIADYFTGETIGYNLGGRLKLYKGTVNAFLASPIIGASGLDFDGHATFLTVLADIGIIGGIPFYWLYFSTRKHVGAILEDNVKKKCFLLTFLAVILTGFLNPIHAALPLPMMAFFVVPLTLDMLIEKKGEENGIL